MDYNKKYIISEVLDNDTGEISKQWGYRVGRQCCIISAEVDTRLVAEYSSDGGIFRTSLIQEIINTKDRITVKTFNRTYIFEPIKEEN